MLCTRNKMFQMSQVSVHCHFHAIGKGPLSFVSTLDSGLLEAGRIQSD